MIKIAICDDDVFMTTVMEGMLLELSKQEYIQIKFDVFFDGSTLLESIRNGNYYDLIYLDIEMRQMGGVDAALQIREIDTSVLIVYVSGYERYLKQLFNVEPFRFISKPIDKAEFKDVFVAAYKRICMKIEYFSYINNKFLKKMPLSNISYFESKGRVIYIHEVGKFRGREKPEEKFYGKISEVEDQMKNAYRRFLRIHQSYLVNFDYIKHLTSTTVCMMDDTILQISKERQKSIRQEFCALTGVEVLG